MDFVSDSAQGLSANFAQEVAKYRYNVFVEHLGWKLDTEKGLELDQFDGLNTHYVIARDDAEQIVGCARLLPTTQPYLLEQVFPQLLNGMKHPKSEDVWELSRFSAINLSSKINIHSSQLSSEATLELLDEVIDYAKKLGAKRLISVSPIGVERLLRNTKYQVHRAGPPMVIDGYPLLACWIELESN